MAAGKRTVSRSGSGTSASIIRKYYKRPLAFYRLKDEILRLTSNLHVSDAVLASLTFIALVFAFPYYPMFSIPIIFLVVFGATLYKPFLGLLILAVFTFPMLMYQVPVIAWLFLFAVSAMLIYGYMHFRTILYVYALATLSFSYLGFIFAIPLFIVGILRVGYRRAIIMSVLFVMASVSGSALLGVNNYSYIAYSGIAAHKSFGNAAVLDYTQVTKPFIQFGTFFATTGKALGVFTSGHVIGIISDAISLSVLALLQQYYYLFSLAFIIGTAVLIDSFATNLKSKYRGTMASLIGIGYPISYLLISSLTGQPFGTVNYLLPFVSFIIAPAAIYVMESNNMKLVRTLDVRKEDLRMKFGEAFEDLESGNVSETFDSIGNYESTKEELKNAVLAPIEQKAISRAYNIKPVKGILFFGPPGTGKTMMMRALANEIRAGFFYVKSSNLISAYPGETEKMLANIFTVARKHAPCVLFFDEIDTIAISRESGEADDTHRHALSQMLVEMDGFQKLNNVIMVGATNVPQVMDKAILRPGRFDKIIYLPLPDFNGRKKILELYLHKLPISDDVDIDVLAEKTERYSGADIKAMTENAAQIVAQRASSKHTILAITMEDILDVIDTQKPSTSLAQIDEYNRFKIDFERQSFEETNYEKEKKTTINDVIGMEDAKKAMDEAISIPLLHPDLVKKYDVPAINGVLLFGPPGTGKTMIMRAVANDYKGLTMLTLNGAEIAREGIEKATSTMRDVFNRARDNAPSIIFIDEIDGLVPKREGASEFTAQITTALLQEMDGIKTYSNVVIVAATNRPDMLDTALLRPGRFDKLIFVKPPSEGDRAKLFYIYLKNVPISSDIDYAAIAKSTDGYTGADISNVCREAKTKALEKRVKTGEDVEIGMDDILSIIKKVKPSAPEMVVSTYLSFLARYGQR